MTSVDATGLPTHAVPAARPRRPWIDLLRFLAAFGIVWAHLGAPGVVVGYLALGLFLILTSFLSLRSYRSGGASRFWLGRLLRFLLPWLIWSAAYFALDVMRIGWTEEVARLGPHDLLIGPTIHLWFLPFVLLASPLVPLAAATLTSPGRVRAAALALAPLGAATLWAHDHALLGEPYAQWAFALTPTLYGILSAAGQTQRTLSAPVGFVAVVATVAVFGWGSLAAPFILGAALLFETTWRVSVDAGRRTTMLRRLAALAFGIYLLHPFVLLVWYRLVPGLPPAVGALAVFVGAAALTWAIRRLPLGQFIA